MQVFAVRVHFAAGQVRPKSPRRERKPNKVSIVQCNNNHNNIIIYALLLLLLFLIALVH